MRLIFTYFSFFICFLVTDIYSMSPRFYAMGNVSFPMSSYTGDYDISFQGNPATLGYAKTKVKFLQPQFSVGGAVVDNISVFQDLTNNSHTKNEQIDLIRGLVGSKFFYSGSINPGVSFVTKGFGVAYSFNSEISAHFHDSPMNVYLDGEGVMTSIPSLGFAQTFPVLGRDISVGVSAKYLSEIHFYDKTSHADGIRFSLSDILSVINIEEKAYNFNNYTMSGIGFDIGFLSPFHLFSSGSGQFGVVVKDLGMTLKGERFFVDSNNVSHLVSRSREVPITSSVGVSYVWRNQLKYSTSFRLIGPTLIAMEWQYLTDNGPFQKNIHGGVEQAILNEKIFLRGGINQGFIVGGFGLDLSIGWFRLMRLNYAAYTQELGEKLGDDYHDFHSLDVSILF